MTIASGFDWYGWVFLPLIIFFARIVDVTLGTLRIVFISRGLRKYAPILGFFEVLVWIVVIGQLVQNIHSVTAYICYAGGFAMGNFVGLYIENRLAFGVLVIRIIVSEGGNELAQILHDKGFGITRLEAQGSIAPVMLLYTIVKRKDANQVLEVIHQYAPKAFVTIEEAKSIEQGFFTQNKDQYRFPFFGRKAK